MWRRLAAVRLPVLAQARFAAVGSPPENNLRRLLPVVVSRSLGTESGNVARRVEDVMPIATGHEREELEVELRGKYILEINHPSGPFGAKEAPAVVKSYYDKRIVGCPGAEGEDEHDVIWFWLENGKPHECPVCSQYFVQQVDEADDTRSHGEGNKVPIRVYTRRAKLAKDRVIAQLDEGESERK